VRAPGVADLLEIDLMDAMTLEALKLGGLPLALGAGGWLVARGLRVERRAFVLGVTLALAAVAVQVAVAGWPHVPARQALELVPPLVLGGVLLTLSRRPAMNIMLGVLLAAACAWFLIGRVPGLGSDVLALWLSGTCAGLMLLWWPLLAGATRASAGTGVLAVVAGGAAGAGFLSHSAKLAEIAGGLALCLALVAVLNLLRPCKHAARGASLVGGVALGALLVYDQHFVELPPQELALLLCGWATLHLGRAAFARAWSERRAMLCHTLLAALPVALALLMGWSRYQAELQSNPYS